MIDRYGLLLTKIGRDYYTNRVGGARKRFNGRE